MSTEVLTNEQGGVIEANLAVAVEQGRISEGEKPRWREHYAKAPYETVTQQLLSRKAARVARPAPVRSFSEEQEMAYLRATGVVREWGYMRSV
jgi:hypothetical protein